MAEYVNCQNCANKKCSRYGKDYGYTFCNYFEKKNKATRADRIRAMSDEELAKWMDNFFWGHKKANLFNLLDWLRQPAEED